MYKLNRYAQTINRQEYFEKFVNVQEFVKLCMKCPNYGKLWSCPPYDFNPESYWAKYNEVMILAYKIDFGKEIEADEALNVMNRVKDKMSEELFIMEGENPGAVSLCAGSCTWCEKDKCTRLCGQECRYKEKMRYSLESLGANVGKTVHDILGIELEWLEEGKTPGYFVLVGGLLIP